MKIRNPKYPWKPSHTWDNCPCCFEQFDLKTCGYCGGGFPDEYIEVVPAPTKLDMALKQIAELKRQLEDLSSDALVRANRIIRQKRKIVDMRRQLAESQAREARLRDVLNEAEHALDECRDYPITYDAVLEALALPHDDTALKEYRDAVIEECAVIAECGRCRSL